MKKRNMAKKTTHKKSEEHHKHHSAHSKKHFKKIRKKDIPTLQLKTERDIAMDFAEKVYENFNEMIKAVILFGSQAKHTNVPGSDIDIIILVDDVSVNFDDTLISWYREELGKLISLNPYKKELHINSVRLTTWWRDLLRGDPVIINIIRFGEPLVDLGGFFTPMQRLLDRGDIRPTPEAVYTVLNRVPGHIMRSRVAELGAIEGVYWAMVESAQALLMSVNIMPPSPEHIALLLKKNFVDKKLLKIKYVTYYRDLFDLHRKIIHGEINNLGGGIIDEWQRIAEEFFKVVMKLIGRNFGSAG
jgi:predicted nucleotidyltransferase/uncharacterized protein (UPF0332 family)